MRFPPPLLFVGGFAMALALERLLPLRFLPGWAGPGRPALAWALLAGGLAFMLWAMLTLQRARTAIFPNRPAARLVREGPYALGRNPMYVGLSASYVGLALLSGSAWPLLTLPLVLVLLWTLVVRREERYLAAAFGAEYAEYRRRVRRWL